MTRDKIADDSGELTDLQCEPAIFPWRNPKRVFVEPNLSAVITRIESTIQARLRKKINVRPHLGVKKQGQSRVEQIVDLTVDQSRRRLLKVIRFKVDCPTQSDANVIVKSGIGKCSIESI